MSAQPNPLPSLKRFQSCAVSRQTVHCHEFIQVNRKTQVRIKSTSHWGHFRLVQFHYAGTQLALVFCPPKESVTFTWHWHLCSCVLYVLSFCGQSYYVSTLGYRPTSAYWQTHLLPSHRETAELHFSHAVAVSIPDVNCTQSQCKEDVMGLPQKLT